MFRIDELITEIHADEVIDVPGELTEEQRMAVASVVLAQIGELPNSNKNKLKSGYMHFPRRKRHMILLAATIILSFGITVFAVQNNEWDIALINFMGLNKSDSLQLDGGEVRINEKTTSTWRDYSNDSDGEEKQLSITGITSIGDKNSAYLRVNTDYELPENFDEATDYILPENSSIDITYKNIFGQEEFHTFGSSFMSFYENGKLGFLISIENCEALNKCNVSLKIENMYWYHDLGKHEDTDESESEELLCEGIWETNWTYTYKSNVRTERVLRRIDTEEGEIFLTKIEISPISVRMEAVRNPMDREKPWTIEMLEEIQYADGTKMEIEGASSGGIGNGIFIEAFTNTYHLGEVLKPDKVKCVKICGENVDM